MKHFIFHLSKLTIGFFVMLFFFSDNTNSLALPSPDLNLKPGIVLCVSLDMPDLVLRQYLKQANQFHIPLVIRGLLNNDLQATSKRIFNLLNPENEPTIVGGIAIDPNPFRLGKIQTVPALLVSNGTQYDVVYGNVPISTFLHIVASDGSQDSIRTMAAKLEQQYDRV